MRKLIILMAIALIAGHILAEAHSFLRLIYPLSETIDVHWFWSNINFKVNVLWWLKLAFDDLLQVVVFFVMATMAKQFSRKLYLIVCIYFGYHFVDLLLYFYDFKQSVVAYWLLLAVTIAGTILLLIPIKEKAKVVSME